MSAGSPPEQPPAGGLPMVLHIECSATVTHADGTTDEDDQEDTGD